MRGDWGLLVAALACLPAVAPARADQKAVCNPELIGNATVQAARRDGTLVLADGRELRPAGIELAAGDNVLDGIAGRPVTLHRLGPETDRYGRISALIKVLGEAEPLQLALLREGRARVAARVGDRDCVVAFMVAEKSARAAGLGLWADATYLTRKADQPGEVLAERGRFTLVEGRVLSVREAGGTIYVNFGRRWSEDFTVTVLKRHERKFSSAGLELKKLAGRRVRVRGTIEERGGPWIEALAPEQIEIAGGD